MVRKSKGKSRGLRKAGGKTPDDDAKLVLASVVFLLASLLVLTVVTTLLERQGSEDVVQDGGGPVAASSSEPMGSAQYGLGSASANKVRLDGLNVLLIVVDTLRWDHMGYNGYSRNVTPNIDGFFEESVVFENAYAASSWTRPSVASLLSSKTVPEHGILEEDDSDVLVDRFYTLAEYLGDRNYSTHLIHGNVHLRFGLDQGFEDETFIRDGRKLTNTAISVLKKQTGGPFFMYLHYMDPHIPYRYHKRFSLTAEGGISRPSAVMVDPSKSLCDPSNIKDVSEDQLEQMIINYDGEVRYVDYFIGRLLEYVRSSGLAENTVVIITADHGEEFNEHGLYAHGCSLYNQLIKVPLMLYIPGVSSKTVSDKVSLIDVYPTIASLMGEDAAWIGRNLTGHSFENLLFGLPYVEHPILVGTKFRGELKYALVDGDYKFIKYGGGHGVADSVIGLYDVEDIADRSPLVYDRELISEMEGRLDSLLSENNNSLDSEMESQKVTLDAKSKKRLKDIGYLT